MKKLLAGFVLGILVTASAGAWATVTWKNAITETFTTGDLTSTTVFYTTSHKVDVAISGPPGGPVRGRLVTWMVDTDGDGDFGVDGAGDPDGSDSLTGELRGAPLVTGAITADCSGLGTTAYLATVTTLETKSKALATSCQVIQ